MRITEVHEWMSGDEVCAYLGISKRKLKTFRQTARLTFAKVGQEIRYEKKSVETLWDRNMIIRAI